MDTFWKSWLIGLSKVLGNPGSPQNLFCGVKSQEKRARRIGNTLSELRTQLTQQFAKSISGVPSSAKQQADAANSPRGFTLPELLVSIAVIGILLAGVAGVTTYFFSIITRNNELVDMTFDSQNLLRTTVEELRYGSGVRDSGTIIDPNAPVGGWNTSNENFVIIIAVPAVDSSENYIIDPSTGSPYNNELVYFKSGSILYKRVLAHPDATGNKLVTSCPANLASPSCPADRALADHLQSMIFTLYDQDDALTQDPLLARSIKIDLALSQDTFGQPLTLDNSIRITLRNTF